MDIEDFFHTLIILAFGFVLELNLTSQNRCFHWYGHDIIEKARPKWNGLLQTGQTSGFFVFSQKINLSPSSSLSFYQNCVSLESCNTGNGNRTYLKKMDLASLTT